MPSRGILPTPASAEREAWWGSGKPGGFWDVLRANFIQALYTTTSLRDSLHKELLLQLILLTLYQ